MKKSELRSLIREMLKEALTESPKKAYKALMNVQDYIASLDGWEIIDCDQQDDYSMTLKFDVEYDIEDFLEEIDDYSLEQGVDASVNWSDSSRYDVIVYLTYEG